VTPSSGWAQRYSSADGDFAVATRFLDESVDVRCRNLAEAELRRRWKIWNRLILLIVVLAAAFFTGERKGVGFYRAGETPAASVGTVDARTAPNPAAVAPGSAADSNVLERAGSTFDSVIEKLKKVAYLGLFVLAYLALAEVGKRLHRRIRYPVILEGIVSSGGRSPIEDKAKTVELRDAVDVHHTTYAGAIRRIAGYAIDWVCYLPFVFVAVAIVGLAGGFPENGPASDAATLTFLGLCFAFAWLYQALQIASTRQATWGMRALGIFRTDLNGGRLSFARASAWYGYRLLSYVLYGLGFVSQLFTRKRQTLHDWLAGTVVLRRPPPPESSPTRS
jgi:uncharacterized RDD family membrane protein YckC